MAADRAATDAEIIAAAEWFRAGWNDAIEAAATLADDADVIEMKFAGQTFDDGAKTLGAVARAIRALRRDPP
jgi:hypothetical protein